MLINNKSRPRLLVVSSSIILAFLLTTEPCIFSRQRVLRGRSALASLTLRLPVIPAILLHAEGTFPREFQAIGMSEQMGRRTLDPDDLVELEPSAPPRCGLSHDRVNPWVLEPLFYAAEPHPKRQRI